MWVLLWLIANGAGSLLAEVMLHMVGRGRHGTLNPHPLHSWRQTQGAVRRRPTPSVPVDR